MKTIYTLLAALLFFGPGQIFAQGNFSSNVVTGNWNVAGSWSLTGGTDADGIPDSDDHVSILNGHTITITDDAFCASLTVGGGTSGALNIGNSVGDDLTVSGNITVNAGATILATSTGWLTLAGNLTNNGVFDLKNTLSNVVNINFNGTVNQTVSGSGTTTEFYMIQISNSGATNNNIVEMATTNSINFESAGFLTLTMGIFKMSTTSTNPTTFFTSTDYNIPAGTGFWLNNSLTIVYGHNGNLTLSGLLRITAGPFRVGTAANHSLQYAGSTAQLIMSGGSLEVQGRFCRDGNDASTITYNQSAGNAFVGMAGSTSTTRAMFEIANAGSSFTMSGGPILLQRANASFSSDYLNEAGTYNVTSANGLQAGTNNSPAGQIMRVNSIPPVGSLFISATNAPTVQLVRSLTVNNLLTISAGSTLNANNFDLFIKRNWTNLGGTFNAGTGTVTLNGTSLQTIGGSATNTFYNLVVNNSSAGGVNLSRPVIVTNTLTLTDGYLNITPATTGSLTLNDNATVSGGSDASFFTGPFRKIGNDAFTFPVGKVAGGLYQPISISAPANATDDFTAEYIRSSARTVDADVVAPIKNVSSCDYWQLTKNSAAAASINVTLSWNANSPCGASLYVTSPMALTIAHHNGTAWDEAGTSGSSTGDATSGTVTRNAVSVFSPFALGNTTAGQNPLPVQFGNLKCYSKSNGVQIDWDIYTEENVSHYEVERSADGNRFTQIGSVAARNEHGRLSYGFLDMMPLKGTNFYRIRSVDIDGKFSYSVIVRIDTDKIDGDLTIYPNPVRSDKISFQSAGMPKGNYTVKVFNAVAQQVFTQSIDHNGGTLSYSIQLPQAIKPGIYYLLVENEGKSFRKKFVVQQ